MCSVLKVPMLLSYQKTQIHYSSKVSSQLTQLKEKVIKLVINWLTHCRYPSTRTWLKGNRSCYTYVYPYVYQSFNICPLIWHFWSIRFGQGLIGEWTNCADRNINQTHLKLNYPNIGLVQYSGHYHIMQFI